MTMTPNEIAEAARIKSNIDPAVAAAMRNAWLCIADEIFCAVNASDSPNKAYLRQTRQRAARLEFLTAYLEDADPAACTARARKAGGLAE